MLRRHVAQFRDIIEVVVGISAEEATRILQLYDSFKNVLHQHTYSCLFCMHFPSANLTSPSRYTDQTPVDCEGEPDQPSLIQKRHARQVEQPQPMLHITLTEQNSVEKCSMLLSQELTRRDLYRLEES